MKERSHQNRITPAYLPINEGGLFLSKSRYGHILHCLLLILLSVDSLVISCLS